MNEQVTKHTTETLEMMFAAYQTGTPSSKNSEATPNHPIISQLSGPKKMMMMRKRRRNTPWKGASHKLSSPFNFLSTDDLTQGTVKRRSQNRGR